MLEFISKFGRSRVPEEEIVPTVLDEADRMQELLHGLSPRLGGRANIPLTNLNAWLANDRATGGITLKIGPATLRDVLWYQFL